MASKDVMKLIISLIILAAGIKVVAILSKSFVPTSIPGLSPELLNSVNSIADMLILGIGGLALILLIVYFSKRSDEGKAARKVNP